MNPRRRWWLIAGLSWGVADGVVLFTVIAVTLGLRFLHLPAFPWWFSVAFLLIMQPYLFFYYRDLVQLKLLEEGL